MDTQLLDEIDVEGRRLRIGVIGPEQHSIVLASSNLSGAPGTLNQYVSEAIGVPLPDPNLELDPQKFLLNQAQGVSLVLIPTVRPDAGPEDALVEGLSEFFSSGAHAEIAGEGMSIGEPPSYWIPLMGTGAGELSLEQSGDATLRTLESAAVWDVIPAGATISISLPGDREFSKDLIDRFHNFAPATPVIADPAGSAVKGRVVPPEEPNGPENDDNRTTPDGPDTATDLGENGGDRTGPSAESRRYRRDADYHTDQPVAGADGDELQRGAIARAILQKVTTIWEKKNARRKEAEGDRAKTYSGRPFIVHLAGRWGSGKSSILNLLRPLLQADASSYNPPPKGSVDEVFDRKTWVVIDFNAWRQQSAEQEPWHALMIALSKQAPDQMGRRGRWFVWRHFVWRAWVRWRYSVYVSLAGLVALLLWLPFSNDENLITGLAALAGFVASILTINGFFTRFTGGSDRTAQAIKSLDADPTDRLKRRFDDMIEDVRQPVAFFIDDLDRCDAQYVVDLLQTIQTVYAESDALFVVAADREWIVSAYDQVYSGFDGRLREHGVPLGYLFVEKIFQLSVNVPDLSAVEQRQFLSNRLPGAPKEQKLTEAEKDALRQEVADAETPQEMQEIVRRQTSVAAVQEVADAALPALSQERATEQLTHVLIDRPGGDPEDRNDKPMLDPNPRAITRLVNAYSFRIWHAWRTGQFGLVDKLPYWCALDLRFPYAAKAFAGEPALRDDHAWKTENDETAFPDKDEIERLVEPLTSSDIEKLRHFG
ncbi:MAG: P-loop NTPase fold protein [Rhodobacter sp.]|nr:P-loop NTPase fold protein [Rhodobacter sp.]